MLKKSFSIVLVWVFAVSGISQVSVAAGTLMVCQQDGTQCRSASEQEVRQFQKTKGRTRGPKRGKSVGRRIAEVAIPLAVGYGTSRLVGGSTRRQVAVGAAAGLVTGLAMDGVFVWKDQSKVRTSQSLPLQTPPGRSFSDYVASDDAIAHLSGRVIAIGEPVSWSEFSRSYGGRYMRSPFYSKVHRRMRAYPKFGSSQPAQDLVPLLQTLLQQRLQSSSSVFETKISASGKIGQHQQNVHDAETRVGIGRLARVGDDDIRVGVDTQSAPDAVLHITCGIVDEQIDQRGMDGRGMRRPADSLARLLGASRSGRRMLSDGISGIQVASQKRLVAGDLRVAIVDAETGIVTAAFASRAAVVYSEVSGKQVFGISRTIMAYPSAYELAETLVRNLILVE